MSVIFDARSTRRTALFGAAGLGLATSFAARAADASVSRRKLIVVICRGAMDGLSVTPPVGDPDYAARRGRLAISGYGEADGALPLDGDFGLHPALSFSHTLAGRGQLRIAPAIAVPDRARSHFEAQDVLETGAGAVHEAEVGWLNRTLAALGGAAPPAISIGRQAPLILRGPITTASWSPALRADLSGQLTDILQDLYQHDALLGTALASGLTTESMAQLAVAGDLGDRGDARPGASGVRSQDLAGQCGAPSPRPKTPRRQAATVGRLMMQAGGPQIVAMSLNGFDTHAGQGAATGRLAGRLSELDVTLEGLYEGLGTAGWADTVVLVVTEFGRTVRINGTGGTDHGTASTALLLGGAVKPGGLIGDWPTLAEAHLYEGRDLAPTLDMRSLFKGVLRDHLGLEARMLNATVFPDSAGAQPLADLIGT